MLKWIDIKDESLPLNEAVLVELLGPTTKELANKYHVAYAFEVRSFTSRRQGNYDGSWSLL